MKFSFFILSIGLMLQSLHPFIQSSGVAAEENVMLKYQLITKNDEVPGHLKGALKFEGTVFSLTMLDTPINLLLSGKRSISDLSFRAIRDNGCVQDKEQAWQVSYPSGKGTSRFKITWSEKHFEIRDGVSKSGGLFAPNLGQFDVILDGPEAVVKKEDQKEVDPAQKAPIDPVKPLSPESLFNFSISAIANQGCDLKLEFDGTKYAPLKLKGSTTGVSPKPNDSSSVKTSAMTWYIVGGILGFVVLAAIIGLILLLIYCLKYRGKEAKSGRTGRLDAVVVPKPKSSTDCAKTAIEDEVELRKTLTEPSVVGTEKKRSLSTAEPSVVLVQTKRVSTKTPTAKAIPKTSVKIKSAKVATRKNALDHRDPSWSVNDKQKQDFSCRKISYDDNEKRPPTVFENLPPDYEKKMQEKKEKKEQEKKEQEKIEQEKMEQEKKLEL